MNLKRLTLVFALFALLAAAVGAHDAPDGHGHAVTRSWGPGPGLALDVPALLEATGLDEEAVRAALMEGATLTELIEANEGDVEGVIGSFVTQATEAINENAAAAIAGLDETISESLNETYRRRFPWWRRGPVLPRFFSAWHMDATLYEATGLDAAGLDDALVDGATIAELIEANEGDMPAVVATLVEQATEGINASAAARIERYEEGIRVAFETDFADKRRGRRGPRGFFGFWEWHSGSPTAADSSDEG